MNYKYPSFDLLSFYAKEDHVKWNKFLSNAYKNQDIKGLAIIRYSIQRGVSDLAKSKLITPDITNLYLRMNKSIEDTMKKILRVKYPNPADKSNKVKNSDVLSAKRKRDQELERFLKESSF